MENVSDLKLKVRRGDYDFIAKLTRTPSEEPVSISTVAAVLKGHRNANTPAGRRIIEATKKLIASRENLLSVKSALSIQEQSKPEAKAGKNAPKRAELLQNV